jgi:hypothetical protein
MRGVTRMAPRLKPNAPRFHAVLERREGKSILIMMRHDWDALVRAESEPILLTTSELSGTPLADIPTLLVATSRATGDRVQLSIYRADLGDMPTPINVDTYEVWEQLPSRLDIPALVSAATTSLDDNFSSYLNRHVFLVPESPADDHHRPDLPSEVLVLLKRMGGAA